MVKSFLRRLKIQKMVRDAVSFFHKEIMMMMRSLMMMTSCTMKTKIGRKRAVTKTPRFQAALTSKILRNTLITASPYTSITILAKSASM
jgi:hypothetical protein